MVAVKSSKNLKKLNRISGSSGQQRCHYLMDALEPLGVKVTRLAHGVPVGGELDYLDEGTLSAAFKARRPV
jgi:recombinational DNA repair protein RecR